MTIRNRQSFDANPAARFDGEFNWDYLIPAFQGATGRKIEPMDIDAHVEIGGHHLVFETKGRGVDIKGGQRRALRQLWAKGYHMVILLWGKEDPLECEIWWPGGVETKIMKGQLSKEKLFNICHRWAVWANGHPCPFQYTGKERAGL